MRITIAHAPKRPRPKLGDVRYIRGVRHVRVFAMARENGRVIGFDCTGGRQRYEWKPEPEATGAHP